MLGPLCSMTDLQSTAKQLKVGVNTGPSRWTKLDKPKWQALCPLEATAEIIGNEDKMIDWKHGA